MAEIEYSNLPIGKRFAIGKKGMSFEVKSLGLSMCLGACKDCSIIFVKPGGRGEKRIPPACENLVQITNKLGFDMITLF